MRRLDHLPIVRLQRCCQMSPLLNAEVTQDQESLLFRFRWWALFGSRQKIRSTPLMASGRVLNDIAPYAVLCCSTTTVSAVTSSS